MAKKTTKNDDVMVLFADYKSGLSRKFTSQDQFSSAYNYDTPQGDASYWGICDAIYNIYENDDAVGEFIDKLIDFIVGKVEFRHSDPTVIEFLNDWYDKINLDYNNVLPTGDIINDWVAKSLVLTGLATVSTENGWEQVSIGKKKAMLPVKMTVYPSTRIVLEGSGKKLGEETMKLALTPLTKKDSNNKVQTVKDATKFTVLDKDENFSVKFRWSPLDRSLYPVPPLKKLMKIVALRNRMIDGDMSVLEDLILSFNWFEIDADVAKNKGYNFATVKNPDGSTRRDSISSIMRQIFTDKLKYTSFVCPPGWKFQEKTVNVDVVTNMNKYQFSQAAIMNVFGFMSPLTSGGNDAELLKFNLKRLERMVWHYRKYIELYYYWLFNKISKKNPTLFKGELPKISYEPLRLETDEYLRQVASIWMKGKVSDESAMEKYGFDYSTEVDRRKREKDNDELFSPKPTNPQTFNDMGQDDAGGRPLGSADEENRQGRDGLMPKKKGTKRNLAGV